MCFSFVSRAFAEGLEFSFSGYVIGDSTSIVKGNEVTINFSLNSNIYLNKCNK